MSVVDSDVQRSDFRLPDFDALYRADADPWGVASTWYEQRKLAVLLSALPSERYQRGWEPGCGPGITTAALADRADELVATDSSQVAVGLARRRCRGLNHVTIGHSTLPDVPVTPPVDLIVVAEFLYYVPDLSACLDALWSAAAAGSHVVFMHWANKPDDAFRSGPEMHAEIAIDAIDRDALRVVSHSDRDFTLDVYEATA